VPVLILDVTEAEADKILATLDPLAAMADSDAAKLDELLRTVDTGSEALQQMLASTATQAGLYKTLRDGDEHEAEAESSTEEIDVGDFDLQHKCPKCGFEFNDKTP
jgi:rubrerythrin